VIDPKALLADLKGQVKALEADLRLYGVKDDTTAAELKREWQAARKAERTAATYEMWREDRVTQVAVAWVLGTVFVRFCEDNDLIEYPMIAGLDDRVAVARERQEQFLHEHTGLTDRDWIIEGFNALSVSPVAAGLFEWHNPVWSILPSHDAAKALLDFWRDPGADGEIIHNFTDGTWNTRFLGDLYQDLSEYAKKTYALLQTPEFVEEFILKYTLDPAIKEFGLEPDPPYGHSDLPHRLRVIDPACGSGHFLLGAFNRLLAAWQNQSGDTDKWVLIARALESVHGVDKNPFAVAIARFRLMVAAMQSSDVKQLSAKVDFPLNIAVGDSLIHGRGAPGIQTELELFGEQHTHTYRTEDIDDYTKSVDMLAVGTYHAVVGNPPYITVNDKRENANYRRGYPSCHREYSLSVPFAERLFRLAVHGSEDGQAAGYIGQITANSFMKREFGEKLIQEFFPTIDLTHVIDTSGAYIPGHGTPTVILFGRRRWPKRPVVRAARTINGEPRAPFDPGKGLVWTAIINQIDYPGSESTWIRIEDLERARYFQRHPWILEAGGLELVQLLDDVGARHLGDGTEIGAQVVTRENEVFAVGVGTLRRWRIPEAFRRNMQVGEQIRDWGFTQEDAILWPYDATSLDCADDPAITKFLWPWRTQLRNRTAFGKTQLQRGLPWTAYSMFFRGRFGGFNITYSEIGTHFQNAIDRHGKIFLHSAPIIRLLENDSEEAYLATLSLLNSSVSCFWLKQMCYDKGSQGVNEGFKSQQWERFYQFNATKIKLLPLIAGSPSACGRMLDKLAQQAKTVEPAVVSSSRVPTREGLDAAAQEFKYIRGQMIALQEELDWDGYRRYGLLDDAEPAELIAKPESIPELKPGERAFEIVLARRVKAGEAETQWFARHGSTPITEIPKEWPQEYRGVVAKRIETINRRRDIALIERPECKRRWQSEPWEKKEQAALRDWLLDRCEDRGLWYATDHQGHQQPRPMTLSRLADRLRGDADVVSVARLFSGPDADLGDVLKEIIADEHVPYLYQLRYSGTGLLKRFLWEKTWDQQREEDRTGQRLDISVPPKYKKEDFLRPSYWNQRGKLDVPKERFISYPGASPDSDDSLLLGWAGWDHREQAHALITLIEERSTTDGWDVEKLKPLLAGLLEVTPWVKQWHNEVDPVFGASPAYEYHTYLTSQREKYGLTEDDLRAWKPSIAQRGRRRGGGT